MENILLDNDQITSIERLQLLQDAWRDGYGKKIDNSIIKTAVHLLKLINSHNIQKPVLGPTEDGEIIFQWMYKATILTLNTSFIQLDIIHTRENKVDNFIYHIEYINKLIKKLTELKI